MSENEESQKTAKQPVTITVSLSKKCSYNAVMVTTTTYHQENGCERIRSIQVAIRKDSFVAELLPLESILRNSRCLTKTHFVSSLEVQSTREMLNVINRHPATLTEGGQGVASEIPASTSEIMTWEGNNGSAKERVSSKHCH